MGALLGAILPTPRNDPSFSSATPVEIALLALLLCEEGAMPGRVPNGWETGVGDRFLLPAVERLCQTGVALLAIHP